MEAFSKKTDIFSSILKIWVTSGQFNSIFSFDKGKFNGFLDNKILFNKEYWQQNNYSSLEIFTGSDYCCLLCVFTLEGRGLTVVTGAHFRGGRLFKLLLQCTAHTDTETGTKQTSYSEQSMTKLQRIG